MSDKIWLLILSPDRCMETSSTSCSVLTKAFNVYGVDSIYLGYNLRQCLHFESARPFWGGWLQFAVTQLITGYILRLVMFYDLTHS